MVVEVYEPTGLHRYGRPFVQVRHLSHDQIMIDHTDVDPLRQLLVHRSEWARLTGDLSLLPSAVEELLRYDSPVQFLLKVAAEDLELGGKPVAEGDTIILGVGAANRDPAVYPDHPDRLDVTRANVKPMSFGGGIHFCLGAQLARIEAEIAIATLLRRLPGLRLDDADDPQWRPTFVLRGLKRLPASW